MHVDKYILMCDNTQFMVMFVSFLSSNHEVCSHAHVLLE